jgi:DNA-binding protein Fis
MSLLIKKSYRCEPFPKDYIFYYDEPQGYEGYRAGGVCNYYSTYPTLGNKIDLTFHKNFYSTHLMDVNDLNYEWIKRRYDESQADLIYDQPFKLYYGYENRYVSAYLIAHDLLIILYSLYGQDETSVNSNSFMNSLNTHISNLASVNIDMNRKQEFVDEIKNVLIPYFDKLDEFSKHLINFTKNNTTPAGTLLYDFNFTYSSGRGGSVSLNTGEILEYIKKLSSLYKEILNIIIKMYNGQDSDIVRYGELKQQLLDLNKQLEEEQNKVLDELLSKLSGEEINAIYSSLENNVEKINDIMDENYNLCQEYNQLLKDIEEELKSASQEPTPSLPEGESYKIQKEIKFSLIRRAFDITKNLIASIFNVFNIFKPKKIYIK